MKVRKYKPDTSFLGYHTAAETFFLKWKSDNTVLSFDITSALWLHFLYQNIFMQILLFKYFLEKKIIILFHFIAVLKYKLYEKIFRGAHLLLAKK